VRWPSRTAQTDGRARVKASRLYAIDGIAFNVLNLTLIGVLVPRHATPRMAMV
jgi:hypothetical protein